LEEELEPVGDGLDQAEGDAELTAGAVGADAVLNPGGYLPLHEGQVGAGPVDHRHRAGDEHERDPEVPLGEREGHRRVRSAVDSDQWAEEAKPRATWERTRQASPLACPFSPGSPPLAVSPLPITDHFSRGDTPSLLAHPVRGQGREKTHLRRQL